MERITVVKIGGNVIDNPAALKRFLKEFSALECPKIRIHCGGKPVSDTHLVNGKAYTDKVEAIRAVEAIGSKFGIGRDMHIGDTIIGIKGRVGFEAAAPMLIIAAHKMLEKHTLTKWQIYWKEQVATWYGMFLHEAQ